MGIPRWLTGANLIGIVLAFSLAIPFGAHANHQASPTGLTVSAFAPPTCTCARTAARLRWNDPSSGTTTQYALQRSTSSAFNTSVVEYRIAKGTLEFWDETFTPGGRFYWRVRSYVSADASPWSATVTLLNTTGSLPGPPGVPDQLAVEAHPDGGVLFSWTDRATNETFFRVERGSAAEGSGQNVTWEWRGNVGYRYASGYRSQFHDTDPGSAPYYRVTVFNGKAAARSYAFGPYAGIGVDVNALASSANAIVSNGLGATSIASPLVSMATGLVPSDIGGVASPYVSTATQLASAAASIATNAVPTNLGETVSAIQSQASAITSPYQPILTDPVGAASSIASPYVSLATQLAQVPPYETWKIWFGLRSATNPPAYFVNFWVLPANCFGNGVCNPPPLDEFSCQPVPQAPALEYCLVIYTPLSRI